MGGPNYVLTTPAHERGNFRHLFLPVVENRCRRRPSLVIKVSGLKVQVLFSKESNLLDAALKDEQFKYANEARFTPTKIWLAKASTLPLKKVKKISSDLFIQMVGTSFYSEKKAASPSYIHPISFFLHDLQLLILFLFFSCHIVNAQQKQNKHYVMKALYN